MRGLARALRPSRLGRRSDRGGRRAWLRALDVTGPADGTRRARHDARLQRSRSGADRGRRPAGESGALRGLRPQRARGAMPRRARPGQRRRRDCRALSGRAVRSDSAQSGGCRRTRRAAAQMAGCDGRLPASDATFQRAIARAYLGRHGLRHDRIDRIAAEPGYRASPMKPQLAPAGRAADVAASPAPATPASRGRSALAVYSWVTLVARSMLTMLAGFVATPYLLRFLGAERLGAFRAAQQWFSYVQFLYIGLTPALVVMLLRPASRGDLDGMAAVIKAGIRIGMRQTLTIIIPAAAVMAWFMPELVGISAPLRGELRWGAMLALIACPLAPLEVFRSALACRQLGYLINIGLLVQALAIAGISVWLAWLGFGLPG